MPSWQDHIIIGSGMLREIKAQNITAGITPIGLAVYPSDATGGHKATTVWIRPEADVHFAVGPTALTIIPVVSSIGPHSARLSGGQEYVFPLHPYVTTLYFLDAGGSNDAIHVKWIIGE